ncbi:MAG: diguanylate cyclase [bacterium]|nr:diguanylate cyclase [bacterium]
MTEPTIDFSAAETISENIINGFIDKDLVDRDTQKAVDLLIEKHGKKLFSLIIYKITNLEYQPAKAKELWDGIVSHRYHLNKLLRRDTGVYVAAMDYLINISNKYIKKPIIIEDSYLQSMRKNSLVDTSTGLYNISYYRKRIKEETAKAKRQNSPLSLLLIDIDDFRKITEYAGREEADEILDEIIKVIKVSIRSSDIFIRSEMGEFIIVLPSTPNRDTLLVGEKLREKIENLNLKKKVTISGGVATYIPDSNKKETMDILDIAKSALYQAKYEGKNRICNYETERRRYKRIPIKEDLKISINVVAPAVLQKKIKNLKDISKSGIALYVEDIQMNKLDSIEGFIRKDENLIKFNGQVVWSNQIAENVYEVGVKFL